MVSISSRIGATTLRAVISERMPQGVVYTTFHHPVSGANVITTEYSDWATNCPEYKVTAVQVTLSNQPSDWQKEWEEREEENKRIGSSHWSRRNSDGLPQKRPAVVAGASTTSRAGPRHPAYARW